MAKEYSRNLRIAEQLQRELAVVIQQQIKDPRIGLVTVSTVDVSPDLAHAKVYVTFLNSDQKIDEALKALNHASGYLRHELAERLYLKIMPDLRFVYDTSIEQGAKLAALIDTAVTADSHGAKESQG